MQLINMSGGASMNSREIAELTGKEHKNVMSDIRKMLDDISFASADFLADLPDVYGRPQPVFILDKELTMTLVAGYSAALRYKIVKRWAELENVQSFKVPTTLSSALRLAAEQAEVIEVQAAQIAAAAPAVAFVDRYVESDTGSMGFRQVCKLLKAKEPEFRAFLQDKQIMYKLGGDWSPYAAHTDAGRFEVKTGTANEHAFTQAKFTAKGVKWVAGEWAKYQLGAA